LQREKEADLTSYLAIGSKACKPPTLALENDFDSSIKSIIKWWKNLMRYNRQLKEFIE
jgi:hypothetical protein